MLDIRENIDYYLMMYNYALYIGYTRIYEISISSNRDSASIYITENEKNDFFTYTLNEHYYLDLNKPEFKIFERDYNLTELLYEPLRPEVYNNENITYLRYENMLSSNSGCGYRQALVSYILNLKKNSLIYYKNNPGKIIPTNSGFDVIMERSNEILSNVNANWITPRKEGIYIDKVDELYSKELELNSMTIKDLKKLGSKLYIDGESINKSYIPEFSSDYIYGTIARKKLEVVRTKVKKLNKKTTKDRPKRLKTCF